MDELREILVAMGDAGRRLAEIEASEGAAGNISVLLEPGQAFEKVFPETQPIVLPLKCPELGGRAIVVSGSGRRLREIGDNTLANLACVEIGPDGSAATMHYAADRLFKKPTTEFNTHLKLHQAFVVNGGNALHTVIHAQPLYLTYLSHIHRYQDEGYMNRSLLRWQPECIVNIPEGIGVLPFILPGSDELMAGTAAKMREHQLVLWSKHGVVARSVVSVKKASDLIEYAETGAKYEFLNLSNHGLAEGLSVEEIRSLCAAFGIVQKIY